MKHIVKNAEPSELIAWRQHNQAVIERKTQEVTNMDLVWNLLPSKLPRPETEAGSEPRFSKDELRRTLLDEQGYLCCYCTRSISDDHKTKIEHFLPKEKSQYPDQIFTYGNLLACCDGGERDTDKPRELYCDAEKGPKDPTKPKPIISPFASDCETMFEFHAMGEIHAVNGNTQAFDTIAFLGLNARALKVLRETAINEFLEFLKTLSDDDAAAEIAALSEKANGKFTPFCTVIISVLQSYT